MREGGESVHFDTMSNMRVTVTPRLLGLRREIDALVPLRDGCHLSANIYLPESPVPVPMLVAMTIYRKEMHDRHYNIFRSIPNTHLGVMRFSEEATFEGPDPAFWVPHGYGVMHVDARGFGKSPGNANPFSIKAFEDFHDIIEWAGTQPFCDGKVGLTGVSYLGTGQYFAAAMQPPHLKAINPWDARTDRFRSDFLGGIPNTVMSRYIFENFTIPSLHDARDADFMRRFVDIAASPRFIDDPAHAERRQLWQSVDQIRVPTLIGGSISDQGKHSRDAYENFMRIPSTEKWLYVHREGEWAAYYDEAGLAIQRRFFDHFLKDADNGWEDVPHVFGRVYSGRTNYRNFISDAWPLPETNYHVLYLASAGALSTSPVDQVGRETYLSDGTQRIEFSIVFDEDCDLVGHIALRLWISIDEGDDADLFVGLKKFDAAGDEVFFIGESGNNPNDIVSRGWLRASHRETATDSQPWRPILAHQIALPLEPDVPVPVDIEIHPTSTSFKAGETLRLVIQGASIQPADLAMGFEDIVNAGEHHIHFGGAFDSRISLPVVRCRSRHIVGQ
jgi:predicted acyl esterase